MIESETIITGSLDVKSTPSGAKIYVDNTYQETDTPCVVDNIPEGEYTVKLELEGYEIEYEQVVVDYNEVMYVDISLTAVIEDTGSINIMSDPIGANIYLNDVYTGMETPAVLLNVQLGHHLVTLKKDGYDNNINSVYVEADKTSNIDVELELIYVKSEIPYVLVLALIFGIGLGLMLSKKKISAQY